MILFLYIQEIVFDKLPDLACQWKLLPAVLVNNDAATIKPSHYICPGRGLVSPEGPQDGGRICPPSSSQLLQSPWGCTLNEIQDEKTQDTGPR